MRNALILTIATLVLVPVMIRAAPTSSAPDLDGVKVEPSEPLTQKPEELKDVDVTEPSNAPKRKTRTALENEYFYPHQSSMGPRLGLILDSQKIAELQVDYLVGFFYLLPSLGSRHVEVGADLISNGTGRINGLMRWIYNPTESFRPYTKAGLSLLVEPNKGLANVINYKQYALRFGGGMEDILKDPASLRWDLEFTAGLSEFSVNIVFGYSWGW